MSSSRGSGLGRAMMALVGLALVALAGCATFQQASADVAWSWQSHVTRPIRYRVAGVNPELRANLSRGHRELKAMNYREALAALNQAVWDVEAIPGRSLRLAELVDVYQGLARAYAAVGKADVADDHRRMAAALGEADQRDPTPEPLLALTRAKEAYSSARFREALGVFRVAFVELEDLSDRETRLQELAEARCYLAFTYFASQDRERVRDELRRLAARDATLSACTPEAPPGVRSLIAEVLRKRP